MDKWEYLRCTYSSFVYVQPMRKVNFNWLVEKYPKTKIREDYAELRPQDSDQALSEIWDYLGSLGWEAYAADSWIYFKRKI